MFCLFSHMYEHCLCTKHQSISMGKKKSDIYLVYCDNRENRINILKIDFSPVSSVIQSKDTFYRLSVCWPLQEELKSGRFCSGWLPKAKNLLLANKDLAEFSGYWGLNLLFELEEWCFFFSSCKNAQAYLMIHLTWTESKAFLRSTTYCYF